MELFFDGMVSLYVAMLQWFLKIGHHRFLTYPSKLHK